MSSEIVHLLDNCLNKVIVIKLKNNQIIQGTLRAFDQHMNLVLTNSEDITDDNSQRLDEIVLRGDNIIAASFPDGSS